jgi:ATP-dependent Zn protease
MRNRSGDVHLGSDVQSVVSAGPTLRPLPNQGEDALTPFEIVDDDEPVPVSLDGLKEESELRPRDAFALMAAECLRKAVPAVDLKRAADNRSIILVQVPTAQWLAEITAEARRVWIRGRVVDYEGGSKSKPSDYHHLKYHVRGNGLVLVSDDPDNAVPKSLLHAAATRYTVCSPDKTVFQAVAKKILRGDVKRAFADLDMSGLDFAALCLCLVAGDTASQAAARVRRARDNTAASTHDEGLPKLEDVRGYGAARQWAKDLVADMVDFKAGRLAWNAVDHGALLFGPPGTGKSLFARVVAKAAGIPIVQTSIAGYFAKGSGHLDGVIRQQRDVFAKASAMAPCLLFIDELDALPSRNAAGHNTDFWQPIITDLLMLLDSAMANRVGVVVVGATNRINDLDSALIRAGRMDRLLYVPPPDAEELAGILRHYLNGELDGEDLMPLMHSRPNATGADAVGWVKAARRRARAQGRKMMLQDLAEQVIGNDLRSADTRRRTAVHEIGHVLAALALQVPVASVTIAQTPGSGGHTALDLAGDGLFTKSQLEAAVVVLLAGRAAEAVLIGGEISTGSGGSSRSDLALATEKVRSMHLTLGMGAQLVYRDGPQDAALTEIIDADLKRLYSIATGIMITHLDVAWLMVQELLDHTTLDKDRLQQLFARSAGKAPPNAQTTA